MSPPKFAASSLADLVERTEYEAWLLETIYGIADLHPSSSFDDALVYPPDGGHPKQTIFGVGKINLGDWRPGFLDAGAPLVLVTGFKLLDMLIEWILGENGHKATFRFAQKIAALKAPLVFPPALDTRRWLLDRLVALYKNLEPVRGTIIHDRTFKSQTGTLKVTTKTGALVTLNREDLRNLAIALVLVLGWLSGSSSPHPFVEKLVRQALDKLVHIHQCPSLGQRPPSLVNVRVYVIDRDPITVELQRIRSDLLVLRRDQDVLFDLRIVAIAQDGSGATAFLIPCSELENTVRVEKSQADLVAESVPVPSGLDLDEIARVLRPAP